MPYFPSFKEHDHLAHVLSRFPRGLGPLLDLHDAILRDSAELTAGEREMIAAYVSGTNACRYCYGAHTSIAEQFGVETGLMAKLMDDLDSAPVPPKIKPLLRYVGKLTREPSKMTQADADAVFAAGWSEEAFFNAIQVCALFNFMNRIVEGSGVKPVPAELRGDEQRPPRIDRYADLMLSYAHLRQKDGLGGS